MTEYRRCKAANRNRRLLSALNSSVWMIFDAFSDDIHGYKGFFGVRRFTGPKARRVNYFEHFREVHGI